MALPNLVLRFLTAGVAIPLLVALILWQNPLGVAAVALVAAVLSAYEFFSLTVGSSIERGFGIALCGAWVTLVYFCSQDGALLFVAVCAITMVSFVVHLFRPSDIAKVAARTALSITGVFYCSLLVSVALIKQHPNGSGWVILTISLTWLGDTFAYFAGRFLSRFVPTKLYPLVSPNKTVIGAVGGLIGSFAAALVAHFWYLPILTLVDCVLVAVPAGALGQIGDLAESLLKRSIGVKDSGRLLPGHGGLLDRVDALLFSAPYVYLYMHWIFDRR